MTGTVMERKVYKFVFGVKTICAVSQFTRIYAHIEDHKIASNCIIFILFKKFLFTPYMQYLVYMLYIFLTVITVFSILI
jgi:hypothetical protein